MKVRFVIVEAEEVEAEDVAQIVQRVLGGPGTALALAPATAAPPALPLSGNGNGHRPPSVPTAIAPLEKTWRPRARRGRKPGGINNLRPSTAEKYQCGGCGEDLPAGSDRRCSCVKCGKKAWERIPAHTDVTDDED